MLKKLKFFLIILAVLGGLFLERGAAAAEENFWEDLSVTSTPATSTAPKTVASSTTAAPRHLIAEPVIRVGLYQAKEPVEFKSEFPYSVYVGGSFKGILSAGAKAVFSYKNGVSYFKSAGLEINISRDTIRLAPDDLSHYFTLINFKRRVGYRGETNFNVYRGTMEYKYSPKSGRPFVVNELLLDAYIQGIAETSNEAAIEYIKAVLTAARSYAYYHLNNGVPAAARVYDVVGNTADQLYLGYNSEVLMPRVVKATQETRGEMVTYNGAPVVTPYFGHSNGKTRAWKDVWGGVNKPWLKSVKAVYDKGKKQWGHGVGMSTYDASQRAQKDGWTYDQLLKYYYSGTEVEKIY